MNLHFLISVVCAAAFAVSARAEFLTNGSFDASADGKAPWRVKVETR